jgi:hypothetical protein
MKGLGLFLIALGALGLLVGLCMDTSVDVPGLSERVHNVGLMDQRRNLLIAGGFVLLGGLLCCGFAEHIEAAQGKAAKVAKVAKPGTLDDDDDDGAERLAPRADTTRSSSGESGGTVAIYIGRILLIGSVGLIAFLLAARVFTHM